MASSECPEARTSDKNPGAGWTPRRVFIVAPLVLACIGLACSSESTATGDEADLNREKRPELSAEEDSAVRHVASTATLETLDDFHGVGLRRDAAKAIVDYRAKDDNHTFDTIDELYGVQGVGPVAVKQIRAYARREGLIGKSGLVCELEVPSEACIACAKDECITDVRDSEGLCASWVACVDACGCDDKSCRFRCWAEMEGGCEWILEDFQSCSWSTCEEACQ